MNRPPLTDSQHVAALFYVNMETFPVTVTRVERPSEVKNGHCYFGLVYDEAGSGFERQLQEDLDHDLAVAAEEDGKKQDDDEDQEEGDPAKDDASSSAAGAKSSKGRRGRGVEDDASSVAGGGGSLDSNSVSGRDQGW